MLDKKLMKSVYDDIEIIRTNLLKVREDLDADAYRYKSLLNLYQYLRLREDDWTKLQEKLFLLSLSSLGRSYAHVSASVDTLHDQLCCSLGVKEIPSKKTATFHHLNIEDSIEIASKNATNLLGGKTSSRLSKQSTSLMITLPSNAMQNNGALIKKLAKSKVGIFRINTAHDSADYWKEMAKTITAANKSLDERSKAKIFVDLAGPKIRTGLARKINMPIEMGSNKIEKEIFIYHDDRDSKPESKDTLSLKITPAQIVISDKFYSTLQNNKSIKIKDVNGKKAKIKIIDKSSAYARCTIDKKVFLDKNSILKYNKKTTAIKNIVPQSELIRVFVGDEIIVTQKKVLATAAITTKKGSVVQPAIISCNHSGILKDVKKGDPIFIDDGKVSLEVIEEGKDAIRCKVTVAKANGTLIKEEKGINFPNTFINTSAITALDKKNLKSVIEFADSVSVSFCQSAEDVKTVQKLLHQYGKKDIGIIAKIETKQAVLNMPEILSQLLKSKNSGVMIARGDLAIEVGFENLAHIQESLLDICDAAHLPVIWATQVLESKMKHNLPSRAEVTDAAMSSRAECVMLNKGPFAFDTIDVLTSILHNMHKSFKKNRQLLKKETFSKIL